MNKEVPEQDLECKTISSRNYIFSPALTLNWVNFKYIFEQLLLHILQEQRGQGQNKVH